LLRKGTAAIAGLLIWSLLGESLVGFVPGIGGLLAGWMPFAALGSLMGDSSRLRIPYGAVGAALYVTAVAAILACAAGAAVAVREV